MTRSAPGSRAAARVLPRRMTALLAAAAIAFAGVAAAPTPARAQNEDLVRFLLGAAAVAVIVSAYDSRRQVRYIDRRTLPAACLETVRVNGRTVSLYNDTCLRRANYSGLPGRCEVSLRTNHGRRVGYEQSCMQRQGYRAGGGNSVVIHQDRRVQPYRPPHQQRPRVELRRDVRPRHVEDWRDTRPRQVRPHQGNQSRQRQFDR